jgi:hypothetical protein
MIRFLSSKLGPLPGLLTELRTGVDFTGRPSSPIMAVGRMVQPIAVQQLIQAAARERKSPAMARAGAGFFGLQASITSPETQVRELAIDYIKANDLEKPSGWKLVQTEDPSYSKLRTALGNNNVREARQILDDLVKIHKNSYNEVAKAMDQWGKMNFVGRENENDFYDSLTNKQKSVYDQAEAERFEIIDKFYELPVNPSWD